MTSENEAGIEDVGDDLKNAFETAVSSISKKEQTILSFFNYLNEETDRKKAQDQFNTFVDNHKDVIILLVIGSEHDIYDFIDDCDSEAITQEKKETVLHIWENISWAEEAAQLRFRKDKYDTEYWTSKSIDFQTRYEKEAIVNHEMTKGLYSVHDLTIPLDAFLIDTVSRLERCWSWLEETKENDYSPKIHEHSFERIRDIDERVDELAEESEKITDRIGVLEGEK